MDALTEHPQSRSAILWVALVSGRSRAAVYGEWTAEDVHQTFSADAHVVWHVARRCACAESGDEEPSRVDLCFRDG